MLCTHPVKTEHACQLGICVVKSHLGPSLQVKMLGDAKLVWSGAQSGGVCVSQVMTVYSLLRISAIEGGGENKIEKKKFFKESFQ